MLNPNGESAPFRCPFTREQCMGSECMCYNKEYYNSGCALNVIASEFTKLVYVLKKLQKGRNEKP